MAASVRISGPFLKKPDEYQNHSWARRDRVVRPIVMIFRVCRKRLDFGTVSFDNF